MIYIENNINIENEKELMSEKIIKCYTNGWRFRRNKFNIEKILNKDLNNNVSHNQTEINSSNIIDNEIIV